MWACQHGGQENRGRSQMLQCAASHAVSHAETLGLHLQRHLTCHTLLSMVKTKIHPSCHLQVELEIMLPEDMSVKESHDIALMLQHKVRSGLLMYASMALGAQFALQAPASGE